MVWCNNEENGVKLCGEEPIKVLYFRFRGLLPRSLSTHSHIFTAASRRSRLLLLLVHVLSVLGGFGGIWGVFLAAKLK